MNTEPKLKQCRAKGCENRFTPYYSTDKYCSYSCARSENERASQAKKPENKEVKRLVRKAHQIKRRSEKRAKQEREYASRRKKFLARPENQRCRVFPELRATEVHHMKGRVGDLLLDEHYWLPVSREGHENIELNPEWAKQMGFSVSRLVD